MDDSTQILYREIQERYVKVIWTHKIQLCQASIHRSTLKYRNTKLTILSLLVSASALTNILKWLPDCIIVPVMALLSLILTFYTIKYKSENLGKEVADNERFAATMHDLRNRYAGLLADIKAGELSNQQIVEKRSVLEHEENLIYSGIVPPTTSKAVADASIALKVSQDSITTDEEIAQLVSPNLK